jgi:predicted transcriptional regulator
MSIQPKWCELITSGKKTVEVRKTKPKLETPFKVYIYCTNNKNGIANCKGNEILNGKVIGEFVCFAIECFTTGYCSSDENKNRISKESCVSIIDLAKYQANSPCLFAWHISDLVIYDKPKEIYKFYKPCDKINSCYLCKWWEKEAMTCTQPPITRPPQSWCYVESGDTE